MKRRVSALVAAVVCTAILGVSGCSSMSRGAYDVTLPGGADVGDSPWTLTAQFTDVLDLVPQSSVKVDDVAVGRVAGITLAPGGRSARVRMTLRDGLRLPVGTTARLQQTSLLGEKYIALIRPGEEADSGTDVGITPVGTGDGGGVTGVVDGGGYLRDGATLPLSATSQAVGVEQVLGALSLLLNGGGLGQFQEISRELQAVSQGRPEQVRAFLAQTRDLVGTLDERRSSITAAIDGLATLSQTLQGEQPKIARALDGLEPGLAVLRDQRTQLVDMLESLDKLSAVSVRTLDRAQDDIVADLKLIRPILRRLAQAGDALPRALEVLLTYPFPDSVLGAIRGDYLNVFITTNLATPGTTTAQPADPNAVPPGSLITTDPEETGDAEDDAEEKGDSTLMLLPPTSSAVPGVDSPTITKPTRNPSAGATSPTKPGSATGSPRGAGSAGPTGSGTPVGGGSSSPTGAGSATTRPSQSPTRRPSASPTSRPSASPTTRPSASPTSRPSASATPRPSAAPSSSPAGTLPTRGPTSRGSATPTGRGAP